MTPPAGGKKKKIPTGRGRKRSPQNNPGGGPRRMAQVELRRRDALVLYTDASLSFQEIADRLGVSKATAWNYVQEAMADVAKDRHGLAEYARDRELSLIEMEIRYMVEICGRPCDVCGGEAATDTEPCHACLGLKVDDDGKKCGNCQGSGVVGNWCRVCARTGCFYGPDERMKAIDRIQRSSDRRSKLLGLYEPTRIELPIDREFYADLERLPDDEINAELRGFMIGVSTGRNAEVEAR